MQRTKIKICGLSRSEDIDYANQVQPDFVGFVFASSKRQVTLEDAKTCIKQLSDSIQTVGVFVNETSENIVSIARHCGLDIIQLHGDEKQEQIDDLRLQGFCVWRAFRVQNEKDLVEAQQVHADKVLLDAFTENAYGGSGKTFDYDLLKGCDQSWLTNHVILAGGLNPENTRKTVERIQPFAVDVSSGVEVNGRKNLELMNAFCDAIRSKE